MNDARQKGKGLGRDRQRAVVPAGRADIHDADVVHPAGHHLREPQPWQYMTPAELIAEIGKMKDH